MTQQRDDYKRWLDEFAGAVWALFGDWRDEIQAEIVRLREAGGFDMQNPPRPAYVVTPKTVVPLTDGPLRPGEFIRFDPRGGPGATVDR